MATKRTIIGLLLLGVGGCSMTMEQLEAIRSMQRDETPEVQITIIINDEEVEVDEDE